VGGLPRAGLMYNGSGSFYGTNSASSSHGSIFKFTP
jgi:hypothetical protein